MADEVPKKRKKRRKPKAEGMGTNVAQPSRGSQPAGSYTPNPGAQEFQPRILSRGEGDTGSRGRGQNRGKSRRGRGSGGGGEGRGGKKGGGNEGGGGGGRGRSRRGKPGSRRGRGRSVAGKPPQRNVDDNVSVSSDATTISTNSVPQKGPRRGPVRNKVSEDQLDGHTNRARELLTKLISSKYDCMVCLGKVKRTNEVWACNRCYAIFHLHCVREWAKNGTDDSWRCPGCNGERTEIPKTYVCFCGQVRNPSPNAGTVPHSCGGQCQRPRTGTSCPHTCAMPCHPGSCPPCPAMGPLKSCFCEGTEYRTRCSDVDQGRSCGEECGAQLPCGRHNCADVCHAGECKKCEVLIAQQCHCGKVKEQRHCGDAVTDVNEDGEETHFSCERPCGRTLKCGNHVCLAPCHTGPCVECPHEGHRTCPCGKSTLEALGQPRESCLDPVGTCGERCQLPLACGEHFCGAMCHTGPCRPCKVPVRAPCRCKLTQVDTQCAVLYPAPPMEQALVGVKGCDVEEAARKVVEARGKREEYTSLTDVLSCGRVCDTLKSCGKHRCNAKCCPERKQRDAHFCMLACNKQLKCGEHRCQQLCHRGHCIQCDLVSFEESACPCGRTVMLPPIPCGSPKPNCPHPCSIPRPCGHPAEHNCHPGGECSLCVVVVDRMCDGDHVMVNCIPCHQRELSCGRACGRAMPCGTHTCRKYCHGGACIEGEDETPGEGKRTCKQVCDLPRKHCAHTCDAVCHPGEECPALPCRQKARITCACGRKSRMVTCNRGGDEASESSVVRGLDCDGECEVAARNARLAEALGLGSQAMTQYPEFLQRHVQQNRAFIERIEMAFDELLDMPPGDSYQFPAMGSVLREVVHELAKFYHLDTKSHGSDPHRRVVATSKATGSRPPPVLLSKWRGVLANVGTAERVLNALHFFDLSVSVKTSNIIAFLDPLFKDMYRIQWVDDANCLAVFKSAAMCLEAFTRLGAAGTFHIKMCEVSSKDLTAIRAKNHQSDASKGPMVILSKKPSKPRIVPAPEPDRPPVANFFAALEATSPNGTGTSAWDEQALPPLPVAWLEDGQNGATTPADPSPAVEAEEEEEDLPGPAPRDDDAEGVSGGHDLPAVHAAGADEAQDSAPVDWETRDEEGAHDDE